MRTTPSRTTPTLSTLCAMLDAASDVACDLPKGEEATYGELVAAIAASRLCAKRLALERAAPCKRAGPRR
jgi:hypothetical protein